MKFLQIYNFTFARLEESIFKDGTVVTSTRGASHFPEAAVVLEATDKLLFGVCSTDEVFSDCMVEADFLW